MIREDEVEYTIKEIKKKIGTPYHMASESLADDLYPYVKENFPDAEMIKCGIEQWFVVSDRAKNKLRKQLEEKIVTQKKMLTELQCAINKLD